MAAVLGAGARLDEAVGDELLEHPVEALLGDLQDLQQFGDRQARLAAHEMEHAVMRAAETVGFEQPVGVADEVAIGEEKQFDQVVHRRGAGGGVHASGQFTSAMLT